MKKVMTPCSPAQSPNMPREQKNTMTSWIDGSFVYSTKVKNMVTTYIITHYLFCTGVLGECYEEF